MSYPLEIYAIPSNLRADGGVFILATLHSTEGIHRNMESKWREEIMFHWFSSGHLERRVVPTWPKCMIRRVKRITLRSERSIWIFSCLIKGRSTYIGNGFLVTLRCLAGILKNFFRFFSPSQNIFLGNIVLEKNYMSSRISCRSAKQKIFSYKFKYLIILLHSLLAFSPAKILEKPKRVVASCYRSNWIVVIHLASSFCRSFERSLPIE